MNFKFDLYITYPDAGDNKITENWINNFKNFLEILLEKLLKRKISIALSTDKNAKEALKASSSFLLILNENHLNKKFQEEIKEIAIITKNDSSERVYKIFTSKIETPALPESVKPLINYNFYKIDSETGNTIQFIEFKGEKDEKLFWLKLVDLAYDVYNNIVKLNKIEKEKTLNEKKVIFLAETGEGQFENRDIIKRELLQHGYTVIPEKHINLNDNKFDDDIKQYLLNACMAIHIISEDYSQSQNEEHSICAVQNSIASKYYIELEGQNKENLLKRIIWISPDLNLKTEKQRNQIEQLKQNEEALKGAEVIQTPIELLKTVIHNRLNEEYEIEQDERKTLNGKKAGKDIMCVYLIYDKTDSENIKTVHDYFGKHNFVILSSSFEGNEYELIKQHKRKLVKSDYVFIYYNDNKEWLTSKIKDIMKSPGFGRKRPFQSKVIYYNDNQKIDINTFAKENFLILKGKKEFDPVILDPLFKKDR